MDDAGRRGRHVRRNPVRIRPRRSRHGVLSGRVRPAIRAWLLTHSVQSSERDALEWKYSDRNQECWRWWCHGSPGIALCLLRLYEQTAEQRFAKAAERALQAHPPRARVGNLSQCHGLSGLGEIYLEAARVLGDRQWLERASEVAGTLLHLRRETESGTTWLVEDPNVPTDDLMVGMAGVLHFLLRLRVFDHSIGFPLLLDPLREGTRFRLQASGFGSACHCS